MPDPTPPTEPPGAPHRYADSKRYALAALDLALDQLDQAESGSIAPRLRNTVDLAALAALSHLVATAPEPELVRDDLAELQVTLKPGTGHDTVFMPSAANEPPVGTRVRTGDGTVFERTRLALESHMRELRQLVLSAARGAQHAVPDLNPDSTEPPAHPDDKPLGVWGTPDEDDMQVVAYPGIDQPIVMSSDDYLYATVDQARVFAARILSAAARAEAHAASSTTPDQT